MGLNQIFIYSVIEYNYNEEELCSSDSNDQYDVAFAEPQRNRLNIRP